MLRQGKLFQKHLQVIFGSATDMRYRAFSQLDSCLSVAVDDVASDIWFTEFSHTQNAIVSTREYSVLPYGRHTSRVLIVTYDFDPVLMAFLDYVLYDLRLVIQYFDSQVVNVHLIGNDIRIHIQESGYGCTSTESDFVALNGRL